MPYPPASPVTGKAPGVTPLEVFWNDHSAKADWRPCPRSGSIGKPQARFYFRQLVLEEEEEEDAEEGWRGEDC